MTTAGVSRPVCGSADIMARAADNGDVERDAMTINFGARGHDVTWATTPRELAAGLAGYGVHNVQLALGRSFPALSAPERLSPGMGTFFRTAMAEHGVQIAVLGCYDNIIHPDLERREAVLRTFESYLANARHFGAPIVATETGSVRPEGFPLTEDNFSDEAYETARTVIRRLVDYGERTGTIVGIEPGINHPIYSLARTRQLLDEVDSPFLGIIFDATALLDPREPVDLAALAGEAFSLFGERIVAVHLDDYRFEDGTVVRCDIGDGILPVQEILETVSAQKPYLAVITEETENEAIARTVSRFAHL